MSTEHPTRAGPSKRLTVLSQAERLALYGLPDFDAFQRAEYFALTGPERALAERRRGSAAQLHCMLQIGYFKAKRAFFSLSAPTMPAEDVAFLVERYFPADPVTFRPVTAYEQYSQRTEIAKLFGYRLWSATDLPALIEAAASLARRDVTPVFVLIELLAFLSAGKIIRPGYTTLQSIIGDALAAERQRLERLIEVGLDAAPRAALRNLLARDDTLSELAALKQDARNFGYRMMRRWHPCIMRPRTCCRSSASRNRTLSITPAWSTIIRYTTCAECGQRNPISISCATRGSATDNWATT